MKRVVAKIFPDVAAGGFVSLFKSHREAIADGEQRRDFVYIKDVIAVVLWGPGPSGRYGIFNVGTGKGPRFSSPSRGRFCPPEDEEKH
ncbi:hypothetical protein FBZ93_12296 [Bradyrhizobium macuxiense]|uniref:NAD-dependent epimerase/dehydratase domain-containing protein n=1 Tax=Bradyrhizobium macuxiense TaxID=1755647 RepID=A0A560KVT0_9BRAD|nr:hypothetical protein FBZ93_12296 [Bradyrhizobium macuxiense]